MCVCVCTNDEDLERRKWFRREITNYGFSNLNVIRSLLSFAQRELIYERTEIGWPRSRRMRIGLLFEGNTRCKYVYTKVDYWLPNNDYTRVTKDFERWDEIKIISLNCEVKNW